MFRRGKLAFLNTKDDRIKIINERINSTEKHLIEMCCTFANCTRRLAKFRDSYDELSKCFKHYTDDEEINESFCDGMKHFCNAVTILADYMDLNVHRLEIKIVNELAQFDNLCKTTRDNLRTAVIARDKEVLKQRQMLELKTKFTANNSAADSELLKAKLEVNRTNKEIDEIIFNFEKRKLNDLKTVLEDFLLISIKYHTKSLEALSASYYDISNIDQRADFLDFQKLMKSKTDAQEKKTNKNASSLRSQSMESLDRDQLLSPLKSKGRLTKSTKNLADTKSDEEDYDDDEEDDEDDEEDEEEETGDTSKSEGDSITEAEDVEEVIDVQNATSSKVVEKKLNLKKPLNKPPIKHPFKALAATHVLKKSLEQDKNVFASKRCLSGSSATGIPRRLVTSKRKENKPSNAKNFSNGDVTNSHAGSSGGNSRRLVTVVESKKKSSNNESENIINCSRNFRN